MWPIQSLFSYMENKYWVSFSSLSFIPLLADYFYTILFYVDTTSWLVNYLVRLLHILPDPSWACYVSSSLLCSTAPHRHHCHCWSCYCHLSTHAPQLYRGTPKGHSLNHSQIKNKSKRIWKPEFLIQVTQWMMPSGSSYCASPLLSTPLALSYGLPTFLVFN